jgi:hypothetical protein
MNTPEDLNNALYQTASGVYCSPGAELRLAKSYLLLLKYKIPSILTALFLLRRMRLGI